MKLESTICSSDIRKSRKLIGDQTDLELHKKYLTTKDEHLREELVNRHQRLAMSVAKRCSRSYEETNDLRQVAYMGLLHAIDRFEPDRGVRFTTFAWNTMHGEIKHWIRDTSWAVHVPRSLQERYLSVSAGIDHLNGTLNRAPTIDEIADETHLTAGEVLEAMEVKGAQRPQSLDAPAPATTSKDDEAMPQVGSDDPNMKGVDERSTCGTLLEKLPERERQIVEMCFWNGLSQSEVARRMGVSQMHISRLLSKSLSQLRTTNEI